MIISLLGSLFSYRYSSSLRQLAGIVVEKGSPELGHLHEERVCTILKMLGVVLRVRWRVLMIAFNYHVFTRCAVVYVEHVFIPVA